MDLFVFCNIIFSMLHHMFHITFRWKFLCQEKCLYHCAIVPNGNNSLLFVGRFWHIALVTTVQIFLMSETTLVTNMFLANRDKAKTINQLLCLLCSTRNMLPQILAYFAHAHGSLSDSVSSLSHDKLCTVTLKIHTMAKHRVKDEGFICNMNFALYLLGM